MEGFAFFKAASRFCSAEFVQSLKVVSDNLQQPLAQFDKTKVKALIEPHCESILTYLNQLCELHQQANIVSETDLLDLPFRATHSQRLQIKQIITGLRSAQQWHESDYQQLYSQRSAIDAQAWLTKKLDVLMPHYG